MRLKKSRKLYAKIAWQTKGLTRIESEVILLKDLFSQIINSSSGLPGINSKFERIAKGNTPELNLS